MKRVLLILVLMACGHPALAEPTIACGKATTATARAVCNPANKDLVFRDELMGRMIEGLGEEDGHEAVLAVQDDWAKRRDLCAGDVPCIRHRYDERLTGLAREAGDLTNISGTYGLKPGTSAGTASGYLLREVDGTASGAFQSVAGAAQCNLIFDGANPIGDAFIWDEPTASDSDTDFCRVLVRPSPLGLRLDTDYCQAHCTGGGSIDGDYANRPQ